ncbi:MAG: hypothetical protein RL742_1003, partial [Bacteroidota bacterium]
AGILAAQILATHDPMLLQRVAEYKQEMEAAVLEKAKKLEEQAR